MKASLIMCHLNKGLKEETGQVRHLRKDMPGSETSKSKCPEAGPFFLMLLKNNKEASVAKTEWGLEDGIEEAPGHLHFGFHSE